MTGSLLPKSPHTAPVPEVEPATQRTAPGPEAKDAWHEKTRPAYQDRTEPHWSEAPIPPDVSEAYTQLHRMAAEYDQSRPPPRRKVTRLMFMAGIFIVGTGVGLASAWWLNRAAGSPAISAIVKPVSPEGTGASAGANPVRGINPSELPYDGATPPEPDKDLSPNEEATAAPPPAASPEVPSQPSEEVGAEDATPPPVADVPDSAPKPAVNATTTGQSEKAVSRLKEKAAKAKAPAPKRRASAKTGKDREIERIKRQADEELKKKTEFRRGPGSVPGKASMRTMLARCEHAPNFFRREQCKWRLCNGMWGKNGCPYYPPPGGSY